MSDRSVKVLRNLLIPTADGCAELAADLYLPRQASPTPALVTLLPYNKDCDAGIDQWHSTQYFARHGLASLLVDFRGTGNSGGQARPPFDPGEVDDALAVLEWTAAQEWCDGRIGMWGRSQGAMIALQAAARRPPALKAVVSLLAFTEPERDFVHPGDQRGCLTPLSWGLGNLVRQLTPPLLMDPEGRWERVWRERLEAAEPYLIDLIKHPPGDDVWRSRAIDISAINAPTLCVTGWRDLFVDASVRAFDQIVAPKKLLVGPWMHVRPNESPFGAIDFLPMMLAWWQRWLGDPGTATEGDESSITVFVQGVGTWRQFPSWPRCDAVSFRPGADGSLGEAGRVVEGVVKKKADATVGVGAGLSYYPTPGWGFPGDQGDDDRRAIAFTTEPLAAPLRLLGRVTVGVGLDRGDAGPGRIVAKLANVTPAGESVLIAAGVGTAQAQNGGPVAIELTPTCYEVAAGNRLRLTLASNDFPRLWPDAPSGELAVVCSETASGTVLELPVMTPDAGSEIALPPADPTETRPPFVLVGAPPDYVVSRNLTADSVDVTLASKLQVRSMDGASTVRSRQTVSAHVASDRPEGAQVTGSARAEVDSLDRTISVRANMLVTQTVGRVYGEVTIGGTTVFARRWSATVGAGWSVAEEAP